MPGTLRAYRGDLIQFAVHHDEEIGELDAAPVRGYWPRSPTALPTRDPAGLTLSGLAEPLGSLEAGTNPR